MKPVGHSFYRAMLLGSILLLGACSGPAGRTNQETQAAQLARSQLLATRMAENLESTSLAGELQLTATAQAAQSILENAKSWQILFPGDFDQTAAAWVTGADSNEYGSSTWTISSGKLRWEAAAIQGMVWWSIPDMPALSDFYLSVLINQVDGPPDSLVGVPFRVTEDESSYYLFQVDSEGDFSVYQLENGDWQTLVAWQPAPSYRIGQQNELSVLGQGSQYHFLINGDIVAEMNDESLVSGTAGLAIGLNNPGDTGTWDFSGFQVRAPTGSAVPATLTP